MRIDGENETEIKEIKQNKQFGEKQIANREDEIKNEKSP